MGLTAIVLAAGQGTRMKSSLPKVLHRAAGRPLLDWVLESVARVNPSRTAVVVGHGGEEVAASLGEKAQAVFQHPQLGTGHAVSVAIEALTPLSDDERILIVYGDMPLMPVEVLERVVEAASGVAGALVTVELTDPFGYGRILRDESGRLVGVVEERDATTEQKLIKEVNAGIYLFAAEELINSLRKLGTDNAQGELYLPDVVQVLLAEGKELKTIIADDPGSMLGVNSHDQLAAVESQLRKRIALHWLREGVYMQDPDLVYIDAGVELSAGARLYPGVHLEGHTRIGPEAMIGPDVFLLDTVVEERARVWYSVLREATIGEEAEVGPYASLRSGTVLGPRAKAGTFVEMKKATIGEGAKVPHLSYVGDAEIGARANIGAGTVTVNFDGFEKHKTVVGEGAHIGADTMLVAPVSIGAKAYTGAGSVITNDVEAGALAIERSSQKVIPNYAARREERAKRKSDGDRHT
jgi:bifunctional UDP-N-acetylglucosamine pyrophosphorylase / glucosamine-1-phosphate N-acetyltransferase